MKEHSLPVRSIFTLFFGLLALAASAQSFDQIEAAEYDPIYDRWFVSNVGSIITQDAEGELAFFGTAVASHGMEVMGDKLYTISGSTIRAYDLASATQLMNLSVPGASFLNGMASDGLNTLWVTDFGANKVYEIEVSNLSSPVLTTVVNNTGSTPNGIVHDPTNDRLVFVNWGSNAPIKAISLTDYSVSTITATNLGNMDGIDIDGNGDFYVSSWSPQRITKFSSDFSTSETVVSTGLANPADISYSIENNVLGVANSGNETLSLFAFEPTGLDDLSTDAFHSKLFPNPMVSSSLLQFELGSVKALDIRILDLSGRVVRRLTTTEVHIGMNTLMIPRAELKAGYYALLIRSAEGESTLPFVVSMN
ncbi:MAG: T9SS type A sorting domain-containing protein [Bacteroidetes bacterium]|nr:T9SS type A sorting domain-containing protein [Bacteroidota bacterium]